MWTGDTSLKYAASRERAHAAVEAEKAALAADLNTTPSNITPTDANVLGDAAVTTTPAAIENNDPFEPIGVNGGDKRNGANGVKLDVGSKLKKRGARSRSRTPGVEENLRRSARLRTVN